MTISKKKRLDPSARLLEYCKCPNCLKKALIPKGFRSLAKCGECKEIFSLEFIQDFNQN